VRLITPTLAASATDLFARLYGEWLAQRLDQPFIIENRAGAGGNTATKAVTRAAPDGYTLLWVTSANAWNATLYAKLNFDFIRDIAPVASSTAGTGCWSYTHRFRRRPFPNSPPMPRPIQARSTWLPVASGPDRISGRWLDYVIEYRDALAHLIPLYIPPGGVQPKNVDAYNDLSRRMTEALYMKNNGYEYERLSREQEKLLIFQPLITHSVTETTAHFACSNAGRLSHDRGDWL
jgi:hypothetical protein